MSTPFEQIIHYYGVPAAMGRRVKMDGRPGIIVQDRGHHLGINFDADKPNVIKSAHPTWKMEYLGMGEIRPLTKAQARYQRYLAVSECFDDFLQFCRYDARREAQL